MDDSHLYEDRPADEAGPEPFDYLHDEPDFAYESEVTTTEEASS